MRIPLAAVITVAVVLAAGPVRSWGHTSETSPDGCCTYTLEHCDARPSHPSAECRAGHRGLDVTANCVNVGCIGPSGACEPDIPTGSVPEVANGIDDDCDFFVDDEQCDGVDNDGDGMIDEDPGSCLMKILFVPLCWAGTQAEFQAAADAQFGVFQFAANLFCPDNFAHTVLDVATNNQPCPSDCSNTSCGIEQVVTTIGPTIGGVNVSDFDVLVGLTDQDICGSVAGCSNGANAIWLENSDDSVMAHELGHILGLADEYCSLEAGSTDPRCNQGIAGAPHACNDGDDGLCDPPPNYLGADLGCDPNIDDCCDDQCSDGGYRICCEGNVSAAGGRCIMSYADAPGPRGFDARDLAYIVNPPNERSMANPDGRVPMRCSFSHLGHQPIASMEMSFTEDGRLTVLAPRIGLGRLGLSAPGTSGRYRVELRDATDTLLHTSAFDLSFRYTDPRFDGVDYSSIHYQQAVRGLRARIPSTIGPTDPIKVVAFKDQVKTWQSTVNGHPPLADTGGDRTVECNRPQGATVLLDGTGSSDPDGDTLAYAWSSGSPGVAIEPPSSPTPSVTLPLGASTVSLVVNDGTANSASDSAVITVADTTPPAISLSVSPAVLWPPDHRFVDVTVTTTVTDACDPHPTFVLTSVTSNEPADDHGDGHTASDIEGATPGTPDLTLRLRAERSDGGDGRTYTLVYTAIDAQGNSSQAQVQVRVPKHR